MLRLTKQADYAIVLLTHFALAPQGAVQSARGLAHDSHLPLPIVSKVLKALARGGLLASQRGVKGGYLLARRPMDITVAQVIAALEGPIAVSECSPGLGGCEHELHCTAKGPLQRLNLLVLGVLEKVNLAEIIAPWPSLHVQAAPIVIGTEGSSSTSGHPRGGSTSASPMGSSTREIR